MFHNKGTTGITNDTTCIGSPSGTFKFAWIQIYMFQFHVGIRCFFDLWPFWPPPQTVHFFQCSVPMQGFGGIDCWVWSQWDDLPPGFMQGCGADVRWRPLLAEQSMLASCVSGVFARSGVPALCATIVFPFNGGMSGSRWEASKTTKKSSNPVSHTVQTLEPFPNHCGRWKWIILRHACTRVFQIWGILAWIKPTTFCNSREISPVWR